MNELNSFDVIDTLEVDNQKFHFYNLSKLHDRYPEILKLPKSKKVLIENLLRLEDGVDVNKNLIEKVLIDPHKKHEIFFYHHVF